MSAAAKGAAVGQRVRAPMVLGFLTMLLLTQVSACVSVDVVRLTNARFGPKASVEDVEVLDQEPARPFFRLAELHMEDPSLSFARMQERLLSKAASLGADAVVFAKPVYHIEHQITYAPVYDPWGYDSPFYGPGGGYGVWYGPSVWGGYGGSVAVPYEFQVKALSGTAIRYRDSEGSVSKS